MSISATAVAQPQAAAQPDLAALKTRQQATWSSGDYAVVGTTLQIVGEQLRQRQCLAGRGPPLVRGGRHRLRARAAGTRP
ncbi:hypothetical protein G6F23_013733 [Rhizopus arrhizus]|nr:hypothetical protein G6F23_013733 [Rhizopus arrhizus]